MATWWVGLPIGICTGVAAQCGPLPKIEIKDLVKPAGIYAASVLGAAFAGGLVGYVHGTSLRKNSPDIDLFNHDQFADVRGKEERFESNCYSHGAAYGVGALGAMGFIGWIVYKRFKMFKEENAASLASVDKVLKKAASVVAQQQEG